MGLVLQGIEKRLLFLFAFIFLATGAHLGWAFFRDHSIAVPIHGGTLNAGVSGPLSGANPVFASANTADADLARLMYSGLTKYDPASERFVSDLATYRRDETRKVYTFTLRDGARWHDGKPVTADDVLFTYHNVLQNPNVGIPGLLAAHKHNRVDRLDDRTIRMTLQEPYVFFSSITTFPILPKHLWGNIPPEEIISAPLASLHVGSGPYRWDQVRTSEDDNAVTVSLEAFEGYYGDRPLITHLNLTFYKDEELFKRSIPGLDTLNNLPLGDLEESQRDSFTTLSYTLPQYAALFLNTSSTILDDRDVRLALLLATDKEGIVKSLVNVKRIDTPFLEAKDSYWTYHRDLNKAKGALYQAGWRYPTPVPSPTPSPGVKFPINPAPTRFAALSPSPTLSLFLNLSPSPSPSPIPTPEVSLLAFPPTPFPVRTNAQGNPLRLHLITADTPSSYVHIAAQLAEQYREAGVDLSVSVLGPEQLLERIRMKNYDVLLYGQSLDYSTDAYSFWHSSQAGANGLNLSNLTSGTVDRMLEQIRNPARVEDDEQILIKRVEALERLTAVFDDQVPAIFLYQPLYYYHYRPDVLKGVELKNLRTFADRMEFIMRSHVTTSMRLTEPVGIAPFVRWVFGMEPRTEEDS